jgi:hypothetical protein
VLSMGLTRPHGRQFYTVFLFSKPPVESRKKGKEEETMFQGYISNRYWSFCVLFVFFFFDIEQLEIYNLLQKDRIFPTSSGFNRPLYYVFNSDDDVREEH